VHPGYASATFRDLVPWEDRRGDFVFVGRLGPGKGVPVLLRALAMVPAARLTLVGDGPDREALVRQAGELDLSARVQFAGRQPQDECNNLLNAHRVAVFPSTYPEGFGTVALEALAAGARVIVSDAGGLPDAAGPTGHVVPAGDAEALAAKMAEVLAMDPPAPDELARADAHLAANTFDASFRDLVAMLPLSGPAARRIRTV
jgi:glycosyltransferase involved in cell wall biosynthesis